jgi:hypothetical protein
VPVKVASFLSWLAPAETWTAEDPRVVAITTLVAAAIEQRGGGR